MTSLRSALAFVVLAQPLLGCPPEVVAPPQRPARAPLEEALRLSSPRTTFGHINLRRYRLGLDLPDLEGWALRREKSRFIVLEHQTTGSRLELGTWSEYERLSVRSCEESARRLRQLPDGGELLLRERRDIAGFDSEITVAVTAGSKTLGHVLAFGHLGRTCLAFAFSTVAEGRGARTLVEDRLALIEERTLNRIRPSSANEVVGRAAAPR